MSRYSTSGESAAALADATGFAWLQGAAAQGFKLHRITLGCRLTTGAAVASTQLQVQVIRFTSAGTTPGSYKAGQCQALWGNTTSQITGNGAATTFSAAPTMTNAPLFTLNFNTQSGLDFPIEDPEEVIVSRATTDGIVLKHNSGAALAANTVITWSLEWEE